MIRAPFCDESYWDKWITFVNHAIQRMNEEIKEPSGNPTYRPQYLFELTKNYWELMLYRYSRGDSTRELAQYFPPMLDAWEESKRLGLDVYTVEQQYTRNNWTVNLDHYIVCFWLIGLALALDVPDDQWQRLLALLGNEGEDVLLDRVIACRQPNRKIGTKLCHPKPYQRLLDAINAPVEKQDTLLKSFVENWYVELNRLPKNKKLSEDTAMMERPYWYKFGSQNMEGGAYFGQWCVEAVAVVKTFGLNDSLCIGHPHYPGDLLHPGNVTAPDLTRLPKPFKEWLRKTENKTTENTITPNSATVTEPSWFKRLFKK